MSDSLLFIALVAIAAALGAAVLVDALAVRAARRVRSNPDPFPLALLREHPPADVERFVERPDGARIHVRSGGSGPTVVFAHGYGITSLEWNILCRRLEAAGRRWVTFDLRGHGRSTIGSEGMGASTLAGDYVAVLEALAIEDAVFVGHSTGGFLAILTMLEHPTVLARLSGFVALASFAGEINRGAPQNGLQRPLLALGLLQALARSSTYRWLFGASLCGELPSPAMIEVFTEVFGALPHDELAALQDDIETMSLYDRLEEIPVPTVVICGEMDRTAPRWHSEQLGVRIPKARNVWVAGKGHALNWEAPEVVIEGIEFLLRRAKRRK